MTAQAANRNLREAKKAEEDEFYTQLSDTERELTHYKLHFNDKVVYCNCDDPRVSNFFHFFSYNFEKLGLKNLVTTCYRSASPDLFSQNDSEQAVFLEYTGDGNQNNVPDPQEIGVEALKGDGDFRSAESIRLLGEVESYMAEHQHDPNATELWLYFQAVIAWTKAAFPRTVVFPESPVPMRQLRPGWGHQTSAWNCR